MMNVTASQQMTYNKNSKPTRLYYLGGFKNTAAVVSARGNVYNVPPVGDYIEVPAWAAAVIIRRNRDDQGNSVFTTNANLARQVKMGTVAQPTMSTEKYTREELLTMLNDLDAKTEMVSKEAK